MTADEALESEWLSEYKAERQALWGQLVALSTNLAILRALARYPFRLLHNPDNLTFWNRTRIALFESSLLVIWRIAVDTDGGALTLSQFKNHVFAHLRKDSEAHQDNVNRVKLALREIDFHGTLSGIRKTVEGLRHKFLSHFDYDHATGVAELETSDLPLSDLEIACDSMVSLFRVLSFETYHVMYPGSYAPEVTVGGKPMRRDIDDLLLQLAAKSSLLNAPEQNPLMWEHSRTRLGTDDLQAINKLRLQLNLPEV